MLRWNEEVWPAIMDDVRAARIAWTAFPLIALTFWIVRGRGPDLETLNAASFGEALGWIASSAVTASFLYRMQIFLLPQARRASILMAWVNTPMIFALLVGTSLSDNVKFTIGMAYIGTFLFVGGSHPLDRERNLWAFALAMGLFFLMVRNTV